MSLRAAVKLSPVTVTRHGENRGGFWFDRRLLGFGGRNGDDDRRLARYRVYQTGQTPLREALNRLTADGLEVECRDASADSMSRISAAQAGRTDQDPVLGREFWRCGNPWRPRRRNGRSSFCSRNIASGEPRARSMPNTSKTIRNGSGCTASITAP